MQQVKILPVLVLLTAVLLFVRLGAVSVFQVAEARNSRCAVEMFESGNYIVPHFNGQVRVDKPPLHYYFMIAAYKVAGVSEGASRFFSAVCGMLVFIAVWLAVTKNLGVNAAVVTWLVLLSSVHVIFQFRLATPDPYLIFCHVVSLYCFYEGLMSGRKGFVLLTYVLWGAAIVAKGPVGLVLPATTVFLFLLFTGRLRIQVIRSMLPVWGSLIVLLIALPWYLMVHRETGGEWTSGFFVTHNIGRFNRPIDGHGGGFYLPIVFLLAGLFPFGLLLPRTLVTGWKAIRHNDWLFFNLLAAAVVITCYSIASTRLVNYIAPAYPFAAVLIANFLVSQHETQQRKLFAEWIILLIVAVAIPVGVVLWMKGQPELQSISSYPWMLVVLPAAGAGGFILYMKARGKEALSFVAVGSVMTTLLFLAVLYPAIDSCGSVSRLRELARSTPKLAAYRSLNDAFVFYYGGTIPVFSSAREISVYMKSNPDALVIERARVSGLPDSLSCLTAIATVKDLFSSQSTIFYKHEVVK